MTAIHPLTFTDIHRLFNIPNQLSDGWRRSDRCSEADDFICWQQKAKHGGVFFSGNYLSPVPMSANTYRNLVWGWPRKRTDSQGVRPFLASSWPLFFSPSLYLVWDSNKFCDIVTLYNEGRLWTNFQRLSSKLKLELRLRRLCFLMTFYLHFPWYHRNLHLSLRAREDLFWQVVFGSQNVTWQDQ